MKLPFDVPTAIGASALLCLVILASCTQPDTSQTTTVPASVGPRPAAQSAPPTGASDPLATAKSPNGAAATAAQGQAAQDVRDNARARDLAVQLADHPDWLARQAALCGPGDAALQARYAALKDPPPQDLRDFRVACLAKDIAERSGRTAGGGVTNTGSL